MDTGVSIAQVLLSFLFVIGLIGAMGFALKRYGGRLGLPVTKNADTARLSVVETRMLDARRKLVLVRRDEVEHLLLISPESQIVVESQIAFKDSGGV